MLGHLEGPPFAMVFLALPVLQRNGPFGSRLIRRDYVMFTVREVSGRWRERERGCGNIERERRKTIVAVASSCLAIGTNLVEREGGRTREERTLRS